MSDWSRLQEWLTRCQRQLSAFSYWRAGAAGLLAVTALTLTAAWIGYRFAYSAESTSLLRLLLLTALLGVVIGLVWWPRRRIQRRRGAELIERRRPEFEGRLRTLEELQAKQPGNPMLGLLARDVLTRTEQIQPAALIDSRHLLAWRLVAGACALLLVWLLAVAPGNWSFGARHYLFGWLLSDLVPAQSIAIDPGDRRIKRGSSIDISALPGGFSPTQATLYAQYEGEAWQQVPMQRQGQGFSFRFYGIHDQLSYYVSAAGVTSERYRIEVVDVPTVEQISLHYSYPDWTGLDQRTQEPGTHIQGVEGTLVTLTIQTDRPLNAGEILINDQASALETEGNLSRVSFNLSEPGDYYLTDRFDGDVIRLTEDYAIRVLADGAPRITPIKPGGDWSATNIEEVDLRFRAEDDYRVTEARLFYSVNGGDWIQQDLSGSGGDVTLEHLLYLEDMAEEDSGLVPGDLISYYLEVGDHQQVASSDIYFIDVQPFEKRYSQSQSGGAGGGAAGGGEDEISARQREILVATWNLSKQRANDANLDARYLEDNADMLSELQLTLAEQTDTLIQRAQARGLDSADAEITRFIQNLEEALVSMEPAVRHLDAVELEESVPAQQKALQFLLRAESVFRDIQISMGNNASGGGGGNRAARDMVDIYELEMDLSQNQYETRQSASLQEPEQALDDAFSELQELARRQQQLAERARQNDGLSLSERWQQDQLRRRAEELQEQLERMQQQGAQQGSNPGQQRAAENLQRQLDDVVDAMRQAAGDPGQPGDPQQQGQPGQAGQPGQSGSASASAAGAASEQLQRTLDELSEARQEDIRANLERFSAEVEALREEQAEMNERLQQALAEAMAERRITGSYTSGLDNAETRDLTERKRDMAAAVRELDGDIAQTAERIEEDMPGSAVTLRSALDLLRVTRLEARLEDAAESIEAGLAPAVASREATTSEILDRLQDDLDDARQIAANELGQGTGTADQQLSAADQLRQLRDQLSRNLESGSAAAGQEGQTPGQTAQAGGATGAEGNRSGPGGDVNAPWSGGGDWTYREPRILPQNLRSADLADQASSTSSQLLALSNELVSAGVSTEQLLEAQRIARELSLQRSNGPETIAALQSLVSQLERLELEISAAQDVGAQGLPVRGSRETEQEISEPVADYFRRLSERPYE